MTRDPAGCTAFVTVFWVVVERVGDFSAARTLLASTARPRVSEAGKTSRGAEPTCATCT